MGPRCAAGPGERVRLREALGQSPSEVGPAVGYHPGRMRSRPGRRRRAYSGVVTLEYGGGVEDERAAGPETGETPRRDGPPGRGGPPWRGNPQWRGGPPWGQPGRRRPVRHPAVFSAIFVFVVGLIGTHWSQAHQPPLRHLDGWGVMLLAIAGAALIWRRYARIPTLVITVAATTAYVLLGYPYGPVFLACLVATLGALRTGHRYATWITLGAGY